LAACIGNQFDLTTLSVVYEQSPTATASLLWPAIQAGLIIPTSEVYKFYQAQAQPQRGQAQQSPKPVLSGAVLSEPILSEAIPDERLSLSTYRFLHDRVQQAAYSLIPERQKQSIHFKVGQRLLQVLSPEEQSEKLFEIVNQLNVGATLVTGSAEKLQLIRLNLAAGRKAKAATAYEAAVRYVQTGRALLDKGSWQREYELTRSLYEEAAEVAYLNTDFDQSEQLSAEVLQHAKTLLDKINASITKIQSNIAQSKLIEAIQIRPVAK
ncbi:MAG: serine/threonine protein kinase, partial [Cyanobacteria bacterium J06632_3]